MISDLRDFWQRMQSGVEVAVAAGSSPDKQLGVRDGFLRYFHDGLGRKVSVAVVPQTVEEPPLGLLLSDEEVIRLTRQRAVDLETALADNYQFYVASEAGLHWIEVSGKLRYFVRYWTVVRGRMGEAWGSSGSIQLPERLVHGLDSEQIPFAVPGTRKRGGMISSLTGHLENRRGAIALSTLHAISTLFYGVIESRPLR
jgi:non-canonical (house-cleaning) NTP pyrophosphatase